MLVRSATRKKGLRPEKLGVLQSAHPSAPVGTAARNRVSTALGRRAVKRTVDFLQPGVSRLIFWVAVPLFPGRTYKVTWDTSQVTLVETHP